MKNKTREREEEREERVKHYLNFLDIPPGEGLNPEEEEHKIEKVQSSVDLKSYGKNQLITKNASLKNLGSPSPSRKC